MTQLKQGTVDELVDEFDRYDSFQKNEASKQPSEYENPLKSKGPNTGHRMLKQTSSYGSLSNQSKFT